jgi:hypothetical protein
MFMLLYYGVCHPMATVGTYRDQRGVPRNYRIHGGIRWKTFGELRDGGGRWKRELWYVDRMWQDRGGQWWNKDEGSGKLYGFLGGCKVGKGKFECESRSSVIIRR